MINNGKFRLTLDTEYWTNCFKILTLFGYSALIINDNNKNMFISIALFPTIKVVLKALYQNNKHTNKIIMDAVFKNNQWKIAEF